MTRLTQNQTTQIAYLARLSIEKNQLSAITQDLNNILNLAAQLAKIDTQNVTPMAHPLHMSQRLRADKVIDTNQAELFQSIAPQTGNGHYLVPTVIE